MKILRYIFGPKIALQPVDPLDDGLREMIQREQNSSEAFSLYENDDYRTSSFWQEMERDLHS